MNISEATLFVRSDLAQDGYDEDGSPMITEWFYVVAEDSKGYRMAHYASSKSAEAVEALRERLVDDGQDIEEELWSPIEPAYGSVAFQSEEPFIVAREQEDARASW